MDEWLEEASIRAGGAGPLDDLLDILVQVEWLAMSQAETWAAARSTVLRRRQAWSARRHFERRAWQLTRLQDLIIMPPTDFDGLRVVADN